MAAPICPNCKIAADDINLTVNISERDESGEYTGDTETAADGQFPTIGFYCRECGYESINPEQVMVALATLGLQIHTVDGDLLDKQREWLEAQNCEQSEGLLNLLDYLGGVFR